MKKVGIFYGPVGGSTEAVAKRIAELLGDENCRLLKIKDSKSEDLSEFDNIIFGIATIGNETWNSEPVKSGWFTFMGDLERSDLGNHNIAMFGLGDHIRYADHFVDSMGELYKVLSEKNINIVGAVPASDYTFRDSKALVKDMFVGLPIDEDFEQSLTDQRIESWVDQLKKEFK